MAEKKRKVNESTSAPAQTTKKAKKSSKTDVKADPAVESVDAPTGLATAPTKKARKRAADFLDDEPVVAPPKKGKKDKKEVKAVEQEPVSLTADGVNGVIEHSDNEDVSIATTKKSKKKSMMAEAERTQDQELEDEYGAGNDDDQGEEEIDSAPALLTGFDSDNDDPAEDKNFDASRVAPIPQFKKTSKKLRQAKDKKSDGPGVVYVGRIPHGFYEAPMKEYFSQFGTITRLRLSRNKKTGASKHFAFIEFESDEVAKIVADTMDNYLMFGHILKCKYAPAGTLHEDVWKGANKRFRRIPQHKLLRQKAEEPKSQEQMERKMGRVQEKRKRKLDQMKELGYEYELPELKKPEANGTPAIDEAKIEGPLAIEDKVEGALLPPPNVPKDEVATKVEEKVKKAKKEKKSKTTATAPEEAAQAEAEPPKKKSKKGEKVAEKPVATEDVLDEPKAQVKKPKVRAAATDSKSTSKKDSKQLKGILKKPKKA
ncbi:nucleolar protein [Knufia fluminis]|uniref:Nucleolar protein n=1 Tax=Knufia fluminis TaxID=191047 RepID=A0AAN8EIJ8_9EURO|nr:nucleolar protein [Knufia fluminis]